MIYMNSKMYGRWGVCINSSTEPKREPKYKLSFWKKNAHTNCITATLSSESAVICHEST